MTHDLLNKVEQYEHGSRVAPKRRLILDAIMLHFYANGTWE